MDQSAYTQLSGKSVSTARFEAVAEVAQARLEDMLGFPLDPNDWDNQYIEIGKSLNFFDYPNLEQTLTDPDPVVNSYRIYNFKPEDVYISIDPATAVHAVKLVRENITYRDFRERLEYTLRWTNAQTPFCKSLFTMREFAILPGVNYRTYFRHYTDFEYQIAVDADWLFDELPSELNLVLSELISQDYDIKSNIKSESVTSHSYTKFDKEPIEDKYRSILTKYAGPNGSIKNRIN